MFIVWTLFLVLAALNVMDYVTTYVVLRYCERRGPVLDKWPLWKKWRVCRWLIERGLMKPPEERVVQWWEHELNPLGRAILKNGKITNVAWLKVAALAIVGIDLTIITLNNHSFVLGEIVMIVLNLVYVVVVMNNLNVARKVGAI